MAPRALCPHSARSLPIDLSMFYQRSGFSIAVALAIRRRNTTYPGSREWRPAEDHSKENISPNVPQDIEGHEIEGSEESRRRHDPYLLLRTASSTSSPSHSSHVGQYVSPVGRDVLRHFEGFDLCGRWEMLPHRPIGILSCGLRLTADKARPIEGTWLFMPNIGAAARIKSRMAEKSPFEGFALCGRWGDASAIDRSPTSCGLRLAADNARPFEVTVSLFR